MAPVHKIANSEVILPDHLVEKIISLMPFPSILIARSLSKKWYFTFTSSPPRSSSLQEQVRSVSTSWNTFCPAYVNSSHQLFGYDNVLEQWTSLVPLAFFPLQSSICQFMGYASSLEGPLLCSTVNPETCTCCPCSPYETYFKSDLYITNVISREWKYLPPRPNMQHPTHVEVLPCTPGEYRVLTVTHPVTTDFDVAGSDLLQVYSSRQNSWEVIETDVTSSYLDDLGGVYLEDKYYVLYRNEEILLRTVVIEHIMMYNVKDGKCTKISLDSLPLMPNAESFDFGIVKARGSVMLVAVREFPFQEEEHSSSSSRPDIGSCEPSTRSIAPNSMFVFELDQKSFTFQQIAVGPPGLVRDVSIEQMIGHKNRIYLTGCVLTSSVVYYDAQQQQWGTLPLPTSGICTLSTVTHCFAFEAGGDPFIPV